MSMDIYAPEGTRVVALFDKEGNVMHGHDHEIKAATQLLDQNTIYTIQRTEVHSWHTVVYLKELPEVPFNSVHFKEYIEPTPTFTLNDLILVWGKAQEITIENTSYDVNAESTESDYSFIEKERNEFFKKQFNIDLTK